MEIKLKLLSAGRTHCEHCWFVGPGREADIDGRVFTMTWLWCALFDRELPDDLTRLEECLAAEQGRWAHVRCPNCGVHRIMHGAEDEECPTCKSKEAKEP